MIGLILAASSDEIEANLRQALFEDQYCNICGLISLWRLNEFCRIRKTAKDGAIMIKKQKHRSGPEETHFNRKFA